MNLWTFCPILTKILSAAEESAHDSIDLRLLFWGLLLKSSKAKQVSSMKLHIKNAHFKHEKKVCSVQKYGFMGVIDNLRGKN